MTNVSVWKQEMKYRHVATGAQDAINQSCVTKFIV